MSPSLSLEVLVKLTVRSSTLASKPAISTEQVLERVNKFARGSKQQDDLSLVLLNCLPMREPEQKSEPLSALPFNFSLSLNSKQIKSTDPVLEVVDVISKVAGLNAHRANIFLILSEAYNNALDHGVLGLDSEVKNQEDGFLIYYQQREEALANLTDALIIIDIRYCPEELAIYFTVCDWNRVNVNLYSMNDRGTSVKMKLVEKEIHACGGVWQAARLIGRLLKFFNIWK